LEANLKKLVQFAKILTAKNRGQLLQKDYF